MENMWDIDGLFKRTLQRIKRNIGTYILVQLLLWVIWVFAFFVLGFGGLLVSLFVGILFKINLIVGVISMSLLVLAVSTGVFYLIGLSSLVTVDVLRNDDVSGIGPWAIIQRNLPKTIGFLWFMILSSLFFVGLVPVSVLSLFLVTILWNIWNTFSIFVYLDEGRRGLSNLWVGRKMINMHFWKITLFLTVVIIIFFALNLPFSFMRVLISEMMRSAASGNTSMLMQSLATSLMSSFVFGLIGWILGVFENMFFVSFTYEMYKNSEKPTTVSTPKLWVILSILGWIIFILGALFSAPMITSAMRNMSRSQPTVQNMKVSNDYPSGTTGQTAEKIITGKSSSPVIGSDRILEILTVQRNFPKDQYDTSPASEEYVAVTVRLTNTSTASIDYSQYDFNLQNSQGIQLTPTYVYNIDQSKQLGTNTLIPSGKVEGTIMFKVKKDEKPLTLIYKPLIFYPAQKYIMSISL